LPTENKHGKGKPNPASSVLKIKGSEIQQTTTELLMEVIGPFAAPYDEHGDDGSNEAMEWTAQIRADATSTTARSRSTAAPTRSDRDSSLPEPSRRVPSASTIVASGAEPDGQCMPRMTNWRMAEDER